VRAQIGKQQLSQRRTDPVTHIGTERRFRAHAGEASDNPTGPGQYPVVRARFDVLSTKGASPAVSMPQSTRSVMVYIKVRP